MLADVFAQGGADGVGDRTDQQRRGLGVTGSAWLAPGATAWRRALEPLTPEQRQMFVDTLRVYEDAMSGGDAAAPS
ncbi:hypothetical protein [Streptomyces sp. BPTC-684]|uniref:hypothetical protein n=1 Tax=Streptomyces sp. BPTC-684 TaxID=3043734 RepID=UPI0024B19666|nr:hypothetical protein [Streptomyces sp. BPTC-684]WHM40469.1 hypothetical protein QIY60_28805 [Streptomyces sp. BPTC-684]